VKVDSIIHQSLNSNTVFQGQAKVLSVENSDWIQSLSSNLNMFDLKTQQTFGSTLKHTLCTTKFILAYSQVFKQIIKLKSQRTLNTIIDIMSCNMWNTIYATNTCYNWNMEWIYATMLDDYAWWLSWSSFNCF